jgi:hypothetical protein
MPFAVDVANGRITSAVASDRVRLAIDGRSLSIPNGAVILPGFVDTHCHLIGLGLMASRVNLRGARSAEECARRVAERARAAAPGEWIAGFGWNQEEWDDRRMPDRAALDALVPDNPVVLVRVDSHASWVNARALAEAGVAAGEVEGGEVVTGDDGAPTGLLIDNAMKLVERAVPKPGVETQRRWIEHSVDECLRHGITEVHDMNVEPERIEPMTRAADAGAMRLRCQVFLAAQSDEWRVFPAPATIGANLHLVGVKYFADGALGSRGALLLEPYADAPATRGLELLGSGDIETLAGPAIERGYAVATHAIGDAANRIVLDAYERLRARHRDALLRVEHAQIVHPDDVPRFASLGIIPTMQATHCTSDAPMAESRLGPERCAYAYGWAAMRAVGRPVLGGSDFPIESPDPLAGIRAFHFREPVPGAGPWYPAQAIPRADALAAYTAWAPLGIPGAHARGTLVAGNDADLVVLTADPFDDAGAVVAMTIVAGRIEYQF